MTRTDKEPRPCKPVFATGDIGSVAFGAEELDGVPGLDDLETAPLLIGATAGGCLEV